MTTIPDHIVADTLGMMLEAQIQPADIQDRDGALLVHHLPLNVISTLTRTMVPWLGLWQLRSLELGIQSR